MEIKIVLHWNMCSVLVFLLNKEKAPVCVAIKTTKPAPKTLKNVVHYYAGSVLMHWDNEDRKDRLWIVLAIQTKARYYSTSSGSAFDD